jgi:membrane-associated phospholipid phosphatase
MGNLTQLGDALIFLSFLGIFIVYAPKIWESLISGLLASLLFSSILKNIFAIPRPAAVFDNNSFVIVGKKLSGFNSCPSGHSITVFTVLTVLLFAFMSQKLKYKITGFALLVITGLTIAFTRVGVGAHYPIDVITGSIIGYISGLAGIFISRKYKIWDWVNNKKYYPIFILLLLACCFILINKIINENLIIFYLSFISLIISLYIIIDVYAKNAKE